MFPYTELIHLSTVEKIFTNILTIFNCNIVTEQNLQRISVGLNLPIVDTLPGRWILLHLVARLRDCGADDWKTPSSDLPGKVEEAED